MSTVNSEYRSMEQLIRPLAGRCVKVLEGEHKGQRGSIQSNKGDVLTVQTYGICNHTPGIIVVLLDDVKLIS